MTQRALPQSGGSYTVDDKGGLTQVAPPTAEAAPDAAPQKPARKPGAKKEG